MEKKEIRKFLKPSWRKVLLTVVLFLLSAYVVLWSVSYLIAGIGKSLQGISHLALEKGSFLVKKKVVAFLFYIFLLVPFAISFVFSLLGLDLWIIGPLLVAPFYDYLIVCIIFYLIECVKKEYEKRN